MFAKCGYLLIIGHVLEFNLIAYGWIYLQFTYRCLKEKRKSKKQYKRKVSKYKAPRVAKVKRTNKPFEASSRSRSHLLCRQLSFATSCHILPHLATYCNILAHLATKKTKTNTAEKVWVNIFSFSIGIHHLRKKLFLVGKGTRQILLSRIWGYPPPPP